jgi:hypothetical protein
MWQNLLLLTPLSLLISCKVSFPIVDLKMSSLPTLAFKSPVSWGISSTDVNFLLQISSQYVIHISSYIAGTLGNVKCYTKLFFTEMLTRLWRKGIGYERRATPCNIAEGDMLHRHRRENLKSHISTSFLCNRESYRQLRGLDLLVIGHHK